MSRIKAPTIEAGRLVIKVEWRDMGYDRGIAITVSVVTAHAATTSVAKLDAFERRPHWHQSLPDTNEEVTSIDAADPMAAIYELLESLPELLRTAGHAEFADSLTAYDIELVIEQVKEAIQTVTT